MTKSIGELTYFSSFTGLGGFELALNKVFHNTRCVGYSEHDKFADQTYLKNFPKHKGLNCGDIERLVFDVKEVKRKGETVKIYTVNEYRVSLLPDFDAFFGGPPCQDLSIAKSDRKGLEGEKSRLFFAYLEILRIKKPKYFIMENVASMSKENKKKISELIGVECVTVCSDKFTPQKRYRNYWFNWDMPELPSEEGPRWDSLIAWSSSNDYDDNGKHIGYRSRETRDGRANTLTTGRGCGSFSSKNYIEYNDESGKLCKRELSPEECEELQGIPIGWTSGVSDAQRFKQIGNAINVPTVEYILKGLK